MSLPTLRRLLVGGCCAAALLSGAAVAQEIDPNATAIVPVATVDAAEPALQQLPPLPDVQIPYSRFVLPNGLTLIVHEDRKAPIVAVNIWYHVGSKNEPLGRSGFAHLFEHLMFNGSENFNSDFFKATELLGATDQNGTTNKDRTNYFQNVPTSALDSILWLESDRMGHLLGAIDQARLDEQRGVVQNEKRQGENQPYGRVWNSIIDATYPADHPYGHSVIGSMDDLNAADLPTVQQWFRDYYGPANAVIVLAGDISPEEALAKVTHYFGDIPPGPPVTQPARMIEPMVGEQREVMYDRVGQPRLYKVWNVPPAGEAEADHLGLLAQVLTSGRNSRLFKRMVFDDQTATGVSAFVSEGEIGSQFVIVVTAKPGQDLAALEAVVDEELERLLRDGPTANELERARTSTGAGLVRGLERIGGFGGKSDRLAQGEVFHDNPDQWRESYARLLAARPQDLSAAGRKWLSDGSYTLEVRPFDQFAAAATGADRSAMPVPGEMPMANFPSFERFELSNGLDVILATRTGVPTVSMNLIVDAGTAGEGADKAGLAVLTPSVMTSGTDDLDALEISDRLQLLGATLGGSSGVDTTSVSMTAIDSRLEESLDLYADVILNPAFRAEDFERSRVQQVSGIQQADRNPGAVANRVLAGSLYGFENPYGRPTSGTVQTVGALTPADAEAYHAAWFRPDNATLVVVGDVTRDELVPLLEDKFRGWTAPASAIPARQQPTAVAAASGPVIYLVDRAGPQSTITAGRLVPALDPTTEPAITAMNTALGGSFTSRINMNLREEKGWSYGAGSGIRGARGERLFLVSTGVQSDKTAESLLEIDRELTEVLTGRPVTDAELAAHKSNLILGMAGQWETNGAVAGDLAQLVVYGLPDDYFDRSAAGIVATTPATVTEAARTIVSDGPTVWVVVGDRATLEPRLRALNIGEVRVVDVYGNPVQ
ncbi:MAG: insulinase family protein [Alphaproteobacteria bacterium]|nr:insulinase family protein [Alphaproteobacteria bacterium]MBU1525446.1 insulinase family protein [Alphaproteobacteria bacterium]MBU2117306.1 insulinase family protein [Alphaproteobacteria bacterium]MBU2350848.1 insulinase family protein [Alphaproteobacteria bacterium]MBU2381771.1 insulinase family protein [Alphaproteobacteria bacterium]